MTSARPSPGTTLSAVTAPAAGAPQKPLVPVAASSVAANPAPYINEFVTLSATVEANLTKTAFTVDQDKTKSTGKDVLIIAPALDGLKKDWREAAEGMGASSRQYWRLVALPILTPSILGTIILLFGNALGAQATAIRSQRYYLDVTPPGCDKGSFVDAMAKRLGIVAAADADPEYRDNTIFVVVPDCGRDSNPFVSVPCQHHFNSRSSHEIFALLVGPGIPRGVVVDKKVEQIGVTATIAHFMKFKAEMAEAPVLAEAVA